MALPKRGAVPLASYKERAASIKRLPFLILGVLTTARSIATALSVLHAAISVLHAAISVLHVTLSVLIATCICVTTCCFVELLFAELLLFNVFWFHNSYNLN